MRRVWSCIEAVLGRDRRDRHHRWDGFSSGPPNIFAQHGQRDLVGGTTLYLPVFVPGGLLSVGDGHAAQATRGLPVGDETSLKGESR